VHDHEADVVHHHFKEDAMEVDSHESVQPPHSNASTLKPFEELHDTQRYTRVKKFASSIWESIVHAATEILHCESFNLKRIEFTVEGEDHAIEFSHERHSISHLSTLSEEERSQIFMVRKS